MGLVRWGPSRGQRPETVSLEPSGRGMQRQRMLVPAVMPLKVVLVVVMANGRQGGGYSASTTGTCTRPVVVVLVLVLGHGLLELLVVAPHGEPVDVDRYRDDYLRAASSSGGAVASATGRDPGLHPFPLCPPVLEPDLDLNLRR